jgi:8-hydroxy-5-deazaflavin:NADPH oxidoreductase
VEAGVKITVVGRGNVGGGLADLWEGAGHDVSRIGSDGGSAGDAEVVLLAVPASALGQALERVDGLAGKTVIDATNLVGTAAPEGFASNAEFVKARTGGPTAKAFNINFASLYGQLAKARARPGNLWCGDEEAREAVEMLSRDAGYEPVYAGPLSNASLQEGFIALVFAIAQGGLGQFTYRIAPPAEL